MKKYFWSFIFLGIALNAFCQRNPPQTQYRWFKGNLHTHTLWSDGDDFPEMVIHWYKTNGYHFLGLSDHNSFQDEAKWVNLTNAAVRRAIGRYTNSIFGAGPEYRSNTNGSQIRLRKFSEFQPLFNQRDKFILIRSQEITDRHLTFPVHINASNLREFIKPRGGTNVFDVMQRNISAVLEQKKVTGQPMFPHLNHPNFGWGVTAEDLMRVRGERFFEVYNGHPDVRNDGDAIHPSTDKIWDIILTRRISEMDGEELYGLGVDDSHHYHSITNRNSNPGRGWVMVWAPQLSANAIISAMERGDFYASSGVDLSQVQRTANKLSFKIHPKPGAHYRTEFIGTREGFDPANHPVKDKAGNLLKITHRYSDDVGEVLATTDSLNPSYHALGDELYVRARVITTVIKPHGSTSNEVEKAWVQPIFPKRKR